MLYSNTAYLCSISDRQAIDYNCKEFLITLLYHFLHISISSKILPL